MTHSRSFDYPPPPYSPVLPLMLSKVVAAHGDNDFVVASDGSGTDERISYAAAERHSAELARRLLAAGVTKGVRVAVLAPNGTDFTVAFLAVTRIGAVAVPVNTFFQPPELEWLLRDADVHTVLAVTSLLGKDIGARLTAATGVTPGAGPVLTERLPNLRNVFLLGTEDGWPDPVPEAHLHASESAVRESDDLVVIYTSGSTSTPKGVIHTHGPAITHSRFIAAQHGWTPADRVYIPMAFFWVGGLVFGLLGPMQIGLTILTEHRFEPADVLRLLAAERATYTTGFPHVGPALSNHPDFADTDLSTLRDGYQQTLLPPDRRAADPSLRVRQLGMTETCSSHTWWPPNEQLPESNRGSLGVAAPGYEHKVVDEQGNQVPDGTTGEICVRGAAMMRGIVGRDNRTVFDADGWYHTKDAGYRDADGHLYFAGRTDDMIKTSGANVAPVEVESALARVDGIRVAYVVGLPDPERGAVVSAVVVLDEGSHVTADQLSATCRLELAAYKVPKNWVMLTDSGRLPYTTTDKIDKPALVELLAAGILS
ncbi:class I adenylate-forming enzyme family protein [Mycolicibacterium sp. 050232]|uniref:class I adenylate-forming enzyme family protein n=1 Tax=Mycolicibacterium sp. 050232 TaxID=3113982 RepID=UPI002E2E00CC|nr:class I adenylate-forming enzyme family protein [Mycolicibacterium sp. 050232]MED5810885.1 class I adenylate-forming enzyme family protein [Mycolicibacterium sp. 050232]